MMVYAEMTPGDGETHSLEEILLEGVLSLLGSFFDTYGTLIIILGAIFVTALMGSLMIRRILNRRAAHQWLR